MKARQGFSKSEQAAMTLSNETLKGLKITGKNYSLVSYTFDISLVVNSVVDMIQYSLKNITGVKYFLTEHLTQDCLEAFFGQQRMRCGRGDNPTVKSFMDGTSSLRLQGSQALKPFRGNAMRRRKLITDFVVDATPLPKRRRTTNSGKNK